VRIRPAETTDALALARVHVDSWRVAYRGLVPDTALDSLSYESSAGRFRDAIATQQEETYCADESGVILGFVTLGACRDADLNSVISGEIWGLYLSPEHWRKGIGTILCRHAENLLAARQHRQAVLWVFEANDQARRFYEEMGFELAGAAKPLLVGGAMLTAIRYKKSL